MTFLGNEFLQSCRSVGRQGFTTELPRVMRADMISQPDWIRARDIRELWEAERSNSSAKLNTFYEMNKNVCEQPAIHSHVHVIASASNSVCSCGVNKNDSLLAEIKPHLKCIKSPNLEAWKVLNMQKMDWLRFLSQFLIAVAISSRLNSQISFNRKAEHIMIPKRETICYIYFHLSSEWFIIKPNLFEAD